MIKIKEIITAKSTILALGEDSLVYYWSTTEGKWKLFDDNYFLKNQNNENGRSSM